MIYDDIKGRMLEDIVILELKKLKRKNKEIFKFKFNSGAKPLQWEDSSLFNKWCQDN